MKISDLAIYLILSVCSSIPAQPSSPADSSHLTSAPGPDAGVVPKIRKHIADSLHAVRDSTKKREKTVVVHGKSGQALAQSKQQNSDNLKNVIDAELIGKLPDVTTADALQRVPGVSVERDHGEGSYVMIRGTEPRLSTVTVDGQSIAGTDA